jgi:hypothetical protein
MRFWAIIFAMLVAWSAMVPAPAIASKAHSCCQNNKAAHFPVKKAKDCCDDGLCNPFRPCTCCGFFIQEIPTVKTIAAFPALSLVFFNHDAGLIPSFVGSCFHPPEALFV